MEQISVKSINTSAKPVFRLLNWSNLNRGEDVNDNATIFSSLKKQNEPLLDFSQGMVKVLLFYFYNISIKWLNVTL